MFGSVTESRHFSADLLQGGLEILCILTFEGAAKEAEKSVMIASPNLFLIAQAKPNR